jgi:protein arginine kinase activator
MNCEHCGKEEVNFRFTSNINGSITEKNLCADCAVKLGYADRDMMRPEMSFEAIFSELFGVWPNRRMFGGYGMVMPTIIIPTFGMIVPREAGAAQADGEAQAEKQPAVVPGGLRPEIDEEMKRRREINVLREQMRAAAAAEDYEKAAALRDSIRRLENGGNS